METERYYKYIVVGLGGIGSASLYWLSRISNGKDVLGLEQFKLGHDNGGSQDFSRIIRLMYHDERYTKLTPYTFDAWSEAEKESGVQLVWKTGGVDFTRKSSDRLYMIQQYADAMNKQGIEYELWDGQALHEHFPQFKRDDELVAIYQKDGGLVDAAMGNAVHVQLARGRGATVLENCPVTRVEPTPDGGARVYTPEGVFRCERLIVTAGAWLNHVLGTVGIHVPLNITQEQVTYLATPHMKDFTKDNFPIFIYHDDELDYYGLPLHGNTGMKLGIDAGGPLVTPHTRNYTVDKARDEACTAFCHKYLPNAVGPVLYSKTCLYAMTRDRHFVVDTLAYRGMPQIVVCCGAGHAYKFCGLLGKILGELAVKGRTQYDISGFRMDRPAVTDANFPTEYSHTWKAEKSKL